MSNIGVSEITVFVPGTNEEENKNLLEKLEEKFKNSFKISDEVDRMPEMPEPLFLKGFEIFQGSQKINSFLEGC